MKTILAFLAATALLAIAVIWRLNIHADLRAAREALASGRFEAALASYDRRPGGPRVDIVARGNAGIALYGLRRFSQAADRFVAHPGEHLSVVEEAWATYNLGNALVRLDRLPEALEAYTQTLRLNPSDTDARYNLVLVQTWLAERANQSRSQSKQLERLTAAQAGALLDKVAEKPTKLANAPPPPTHPAPRIDR